MNDLLPCPFCGHAAEYWQYVFTHEAGCSNDACIVRPKASLYRVPCNDGLFASGDGSKEDVIAAWNKREAK
jgi:hypothetical protein